MGSVSLTNAVWMTMIGVITTFLVFYVKLLCQSVYDKKISKPNQQALHLPRFLRGGRTSHLRKFQRIASDVVCDVQSALEPPHCHKHARSFLPILSDVRRRGELLLSQQTLAHRVTAAEREQKLCTLVGQLIILESRLKALPKPNVTIEEVLLGKFE